MHVRQIKPFQLALVEQTHVLEEVLRICPLRHEGTKAQEPWNITYPGAQTHELLWPFQTSPLEQVMHELPFQFELSGHAHLFAEVLQVWPFGQVMQATPFHWVFPGH